MSQPMTIEELLDSRTTLPAAFRKTHPIGTVWAGTVVKSEVRQTRDDDGNVETWDDGNPKMQIIVAIQTSQHDPERTNDDGIRGIYIKAWGEQFKAFKACMEAAGTKRVEPGGMFAAKYVGDGEQPKNKMLSPAKLMQYEYKPPSGIETLLDSTNGSANPVEAKVNAADQQSWQEAPPVPADMQATAPVGSAAAVPKPQPAPQPEPTPTPAPQPQPQPVPAAAAPAANGAVDPMQLLATVKAFIAMGMTDEQIAGATGAPLPAVSAIRNLPA